MAHFVTDRIVTGLQRFALVLIGLAIIVVVAAIGWTRTPDALLHAASIAAFAFGLPALALFALAYWLDAEAVKVEGERPAKRDESAKHPFREPVLGYVAAVGATLAAWGLRAIVDAYLPNYVPFLTFVLGVAVAGWLGGLGPAVLATLLSAGIARYFYMVPAHSLRLDDVQIAAALGLFVFVATLIGALTAALHAALRRIEVLRRGGGPAPSRAPVSAPEPALPAPPADLQ